jgi:hypothetical protein
MPLYVSYDLILDKRKKKGSLLMQSYNSSVFKILSLVSSFNIVTSQLKIN